MEEEGEKEESKRGSPVCKKRKRCRKAKNKPPSSLGEDVCFRCYDGGGLIICNQRGCPKAYHAACTGRDADFLKKSKNWKCSWHICNNCEKTAHYMCYTCPFSWCKGCINEAEFLYVKRNKGLCKGCKELVMLIEKNEQGNKEMLQVDFNFSYFKDYWIDLKGKLLFTAEELTQPRNTLTGSIVLAKKELHDRLDFKVSNSVSSSENLEASSFQRRKVIKCSKTSTQDGSCSEAWMGDDRVSGSFDTEWACKELLDFVAYMKNGDTSVLSHFDVQALLLEYIAKSNLRDPCQKSQIFCDSRLKNLFGKAFIGHFEMFRHLRTQLIKKDTQSDCIQARLFNTKSRQMEARGNTVPPREVVEDKIGKMCKTGYHILPEANHDNYAGHVVPLEMKVNNETPANESGVERQTSEHSLQSNLHCATIDTKLKAESNGKPLKRVVVYKRSKVCERGERRSVQSKLDDYAAIDVHNINLIFLRYKLVEDLLEDTDTFHDKIVGSFVRIRVDSNHNQEMHRLVQVIGTERVPQPYECGERTTDIMLEILHSSKTEIIPIHSVSKEEFSEDECRSLRESIKSGSVGHLTVGAVQQKARVLQEVRVNDWLEKEKFRLSNLRDWASEKGRRKEQRECIRTLQLLSSPEERLRRIKEIPEIHADSSMGPSSKNQEQAESDDKRKECSMRQRDIRFDSKGRKPVSSDKGGSARSVTWSTERKNSATALEPSRNIIRNCVWDKKIITNDSGQRTDESSWNQRDSHEPSNGENDRNQMAAAALDTGTFNGEVVVGSGSESLLVSLVSKTDKLWHYQDPSGEVQGPFSMLQLCKWSTSASFPANLRIWRTMEMQEDSILLTEALNHNFSHSPKVADASENNSVNKIVKGHEASTAPLSYQLTLSSISPVSSKAMGGGNQAEDTTIVEKHQEKSEDRLSGYQSWCDIGTVNNGWSGEAQNTTMWERQRENNNGDRFLGHQQGSYEGHANNGRVEGAGNTTTWGSHQESSNGDRFIGHQSGSHQERNNGDRFIGHQRGSYEGHANNGWGEGARNTATWGSHQENNNGDRFFGHQRESYEGHASNGWGEGARNTTTWGSHQGNNNGDRESENSVERDDNSRWGSRREYNGNRFSHRSNEPHWNRQSTFVGGGSEWRLCRHYEKKGYCWYGDKCGFRHDNGHGDEIT